MRSRSLFWTFAGAFLAVLVVATIVQIVVSIGVLRPLALQGARENASATIDAAARDLIALPDAGDVQRIIPALRAHPLAERSDVLVFCVASGPMVPDRRLPPRVHREVALAAARAGLTDSLLAMQPPTRFPQAPLGRAGPPGFRGPPDGRPPGGPRDFPPPGGPPDEGFPGGSPPGEGPLRDIQDLAPGTAPAGPNEPFMVLAHRPLVRDGGVLGELAAVGPVRRAVPWALPGARAVLLLPIAVLAAAAAGLVMVRIVVRRLRSLETAADRVIAGDLNARIDAEGGDEIGRLEERFNRMTDRLAAARTRLEDNDRQRRQLLADITHELATPLTSIRGYVETLLDPAVETTGEEREAYLRDVLDESRRLDDMIAELFDLARLEAGAAPLERVRLDWRALCRNITRRLEPRFHEAGLTLTWDGVGDSDAAAWVTADGRRLEQVVENLMVNALRYVAAGGHVWLSIAQVATPDGPRHRLTVRDDGPGIAAQDVPHVFERFYRAESVRSMGGTGLGLAIVAEIVRQHGGAVRAEPVAPHGVAFSVDLKAERG